MINEIFIISRSDSVLNLIMVYVNVIFDGTKSGALNARRAGPNV